MKFGLYKTLFLAVMFFNLFFTTVIHAAPLSVGEDVASEPLIEEAAIEESPDFIMDQTGNSSHDDSHFSDEWESQGNKSLSAATGSSDAVENEKIEKKTSKSEETLNPEEKRNPESVQKKDVQEEGGEKKEDSLLETNEETSQP